MINSCIIEINIKYSIEYSLIIIVCVQFLDSLNYKKAKTHHFVPKLSTWALSSDFSFPDINSDIFLNTPQLIEKYGFPSESHSVETDDHYFLNLHRIPFGRNETQKGNQTYYKNNFNTEGGEHNCNEYYSNKWCINRKPVAFLMHGIWGSSSDWLMNTVDKALPYKLADAGYDVWLAFKFCTGNSRGNTYSTRHKFLPYSDSEYWDFSFHEMGVYDNVAAIDYILNMTQQNRLFYIGHSTGATLLFITLSARPEYANKVQFFGAASPVVYLSNSKSPLAKIASLSLITKRLMNSISRGNILHSFFTSILRQLGPKICGNRITSKKLCKSILHVFIGFDGPQINQTQLPVIASHTPSPTSIRTVDNFLQYFKTERFSMYDFGMKKNYYKYGSIIAPEYDLEKTRVPTAIFYGLNDLISVPKDTRKLATRIPNLVLFSEVKWPLWNHLDAIYAKDADTLLYDPLMKLMQKYI